MPITEELLNKNLTEIPFGLPLTTVSGTTSGASGSAVETNRDVVKSVPHATRNTNQGNGIIYATVDDVDGEDGIEHTPSSPVVPELAYAEP